MGTFLSLFNFGMASLQGIVLGIQAIQGDKAAGLDKKAMAVDVLKVTLASAASVITDPVQAQLAQTAAVAVASIIGSFGAIDAAVKHAKSNGTYQAATAVASTLNPAPPPPAEGTNLAQART